MVSIPHIEDIPPRELIGLLQNKTWKITEKLDGASFVFGLDQNGVFYTERKNAPRCYTVEDWGNELWADAYRQAFQVAKSLVDLLLDNDLLSPGDYFGTELLYSSLPNSVPLTALTYTATLVITHSNISDKRGQLWDLVIDGFIYFENGLVCLTPDGITLVKEPSKMNWAVMSIEQKSIGPANLRQIRMVDILEEFLRTPSEVLDFTYEEILTINLGRKHPKAGKSNWNDVKALLKKERERVKDLYAGALLAYKTFIIKSNIRFSKTDLSEGVVVEAGDKVFKLVQRDIFPILNLYTHRVKYWIVGGRRPARPSFLSRTKDWPVEKRLQRLDALRKRYIANRHRLKLDTRLPADLTTVSELLQYEGQLHARTLAMFYDTRKRIENGR